MKPNAYECWKVKKEQNLSNEDYKKLLNEKKIIDERMTEWLKVTVCKTVF